MVPFSDTVDDFLYLACRIIDFRLSVPMDMLFLFIKIKLKQNEWISYT